MFRMKIKSRIVIAGLLSLAAFGAFASLPPGTAPPDTDAMLRAAQIMERAISAIAATREQGGAGFDLSSDPNKTGLIGPQYGGLMTTVGDLEAKRSTTNPNFAGFIVRLLTEAGVRSGDHIAIGASGSFPALLVASLAAAKAMDVQPVTMLSLGASSYGATDPDFNLLDIYGILLREHVCSTPPALVSLGGDKDVGDDFDPAVRDRLALRLAAGAIPFLREPSLEQNVSRRMRIYEREASGRIAAFINSGGGYANLGTSRLALDVRPGLNTFLQLPSAVERGALFEMAARRVPVIHLLFIKGLVMQAGLPWDPIPLPKPHAAPPPQGGRTRQFWLISTTYFAALLLLIFLRREHVPSP